MSNCNLQTWRSVLLGLDASIQQAIDSLEASSMQIVLAVSQDDQLIGTLTDGDIRRAFLRGLKLEDSIDSIINRNPLVVPAEMSRQLVLQLMQINKIHQLPVVDKNDKVIDLHVMDFILAPNSVENIMLIMAGGKGTRLGSHTQNCPKPMLEVGGKPMLQHIIEKAIADGFKNFILSLHYLGHMVEEYFGDGSRLGVRIEYIREVVPLGTAGCLSLLEKTPSLPIVVTNGDVLTNINYSELLEYHNRHQADATMAVRQHEIQSQFGVVQTNGIEIETFQEKPVYRSNVNAGIYVLDPTVIQNLEYQKHCDMPTLFERVKSHGGRTIVYPIHESWLDVGRPEDLVIARNSQNKPVEN